MNPQRHRTFDLLRHRAAHITVFVVAMLSLALQSLNAQAVDLVADDYRLGKAIGKFDDITQIAFAFKLRPPRRLRAQYLEFAVGAVNTPEETRAMISLGPVWRIPLASDRVSVKLGFSPTLFSGSEFNGRDLGGNLHFTSSAEIATEIGEHRAASLALRIQHTSNGGLNETNPGMDIVGLSFGYQFGR